MAAIAVRTGDPVNMAPLLSGQLSFCAKHTRVAAGYRTDFVQRIAMHWGAVLSATLCREKLSQIGSSA